jgi:hypothetical protein
MITSFNIFEARLEDLLVLKTDNDMFDKFINKDFNNDVKLLKYVYIKTYNKKLYIDWFDVKKHSFIQRIKERTPFKSVSEFNNYFKYLINYLFNNKFNEFENKSHYKNLRSTFCIYSKEYNFYIPISYKYNNLFEDDAKFFIKSISLTTCNKQSKFYINI